MDIQKSQRLEVYPSDLYDRLEFNRVLHWLSDFCLSEEAKNLSRELAPTTNRSEIFNSLSQVRELLELDDAGHSFPNLLKDSMQSVLQDLAIQEFVLTEESIMLILKEQKVYKDLLEYFDEHSDNVPNLFSLREKLNYDETPVLKINQIFNEEGKVKDEASPTLFSIRKKLQVQSGEIDKAFRRTLVSLRARGILADPPESVRNGRRVVAILSENKRQVSGILHDESESGKTSFIEPEEVVYLNNEWFELIRDEQREIYKILKLLCIDIRPYHAYIENSWSFIVQSDFMHAKAKLAKKIGRGVPGIKAEDSIDLIKAYHPILLVLNQSNGKKTEPLDIRMNEEQRVVLVSGPNAGGKSVVLKTVALIQLMFQSGLAVPANSTSELAVFDKIIADLGDAQSLDDELSTYSSKLRNMNYLIRNAKAGVLFFLDEFGSGTDPQMGGAISEAILEELMRTKSFGVINTHFGNIKAYASRHPGIMNAAMIFDEVNLKPTYQMVMGQPGNSYTFVIAQNNQIPKHIIERAKSLGGQQQVKYDDLLRQLERERKLLDDQTKETEKTHNRLKELQKRWENQVKELEIQKKKMRYDLIVQKQQLQDEKEQVLKQLQTDLKKSKQVEEDTQSKLDESKKKKIALEEVRQTIKQDLSVLENTLPLEVGAWVQIESSTEIGKIESIKKGSAIVIFDNMRTSLPISELKRVQASVTPINRSTQIKVEKEKSSGELDIRGKNKQESLGLLEEFLDKSLLNNAYEIRILHGKGTGQLREWVKQYLRDFPGIAQIYHPEPSSGGDGVTIVRFL